MTPAEKMAQRLDYQARMIGKDLPTMETNQQAVATQAIDLCDKTSALIRRLGAALRDAVQILGEGETEWFKRAHAEALRNVREEE